MKYHFILFFTSLSFILLGQGGGNFDSIQIENIVITHSKIPIQSRSTAKPIQILTADAIRRSGGSDISQILNDAVGLDVAGSLSNPSKDKSVFLRGASGEYTLILLNGQPVLDPSGIGGVADLRSIPIANVQRIEISKGSQSTLYGSDAIAGVINIITDHANLKEGVNGSIHLGYGSFNSLSSNASVNGKVNGFDFNLGVVREQSDGISEARSPDPDLVYETDGMERTGLSLGIGHQLSDKLSAKLYGQYTDFQADTDTDSFLDSEVNKYLSELLNMGASLEYQSENWNGAIKYTSSTADRNFISDFGDFPFMGRFHNIDAYANRSLSSKAEFIFGLNYQNHGMKDENATVLNPSNNIISPYLSMIYSANEKFNSEIGIRLNDHSTFGTNVNYSIAASYWLTADLKIFSNFSTGFKAPNLFQLYGAFGANIELNPQRSRSFEIGFQAPGINAFVNPQITFFTRNVDDVIVFTNQYENIEEQNDMGVEVELGFDLTEKLSLRVHYTYLDGENSMLIENLYRRPKHQFGVKAFWQPINKIHMNLGMKSVGERTDLFFNPNNFTSEEVTLDQYFYGTFYLDYSIKQNLSAYLNIQNLTNSDFQEIYGFNTLGTNFKIGLNWKLQ